MSANRDAKNRGGKPPRRNLAEDIRQILYPRQFRIAAPELIEFALSTDRTAAGAAPPPQERETKAASSNKSIREMATCLWYVKSKLFEIPWSDFDATLDDPKSRRALGRINRTIDSLRSAGIVLEDPVGKSYPTGGEALMKPIQFVPTRGITMDMVSETVMPIIYRDEQLIQRAEVFVNVPEVEDGAGEEETTAQERHETGD